MGDIALSLLYAVPMTILLTAVAFGIGVVVGIPICAMRMSKVSALRSSAASLILFVRSIPPLVWLFLIFFGLGSGYIQLTAFWAAAIGLGMITAVNMAEIYRGSLAAVHVGQWEASSALGLPQFQVLLKIIGPQVARVSLPAMATYAIALLKDSAVASAIGVSELAFNAYHISQQTFRGIDVYATAAAYYIALSLPIAWISRSVDARLRRRVAR